jgi:hypothetical protein
MEESPIRLTIYLTREDYRILSDMAKSELRKPRAQLIFLVRQEAIRRGMCGGQTEKDAAVSKARHGRSAQGKEVR